MEKGLKYGLLAAAAGLGIYSIWKANQEEEEVAALPAAQTTSQPELSYGEWRFCEQTAVSGFSEYWALPAPPEIPGKTLVNLMIQYAESNDFYPFGAVPYCVNGNYYGMLLRPQTIPFSGTFRIVAIYI